MDVPVDLRAEQAMAERAMAALEKVIDPEVGIDVVSLGLVYEVRVDANNVGVRMTMTTPACPLGPYMREEAEAAIRQSCPEAETVDVQIVFDPPWSPDRMSDEARNWLGWGPQPSK